MHDQIGIAADRRREVAVVIQPQREVSEILLGVKGALHRSQNDVRQETLFRSSDDRFQNPLQLAGPDLFDVAAQNELEFFQDFAQILELARIHAIGALVNIDEVGARSGLADRFRSSNESVWDSDDDVAGLYAGSRQGESNGIRSAGYTNAMSRAAKLCEVSLKFFYLRTSNESCCTQRVS